MLMLLADEVAEAAAEVAVAVIDMAMDVMDDIDMLDMTFGQARNGLDEHEREEEL